MAKFKVGDKAYYFHMAKKPKEFVDHEEVNED